MADGELVRRWLAARAELGDPPIFLPPGAREAALRAWRERLRGVGAGRAVEEAPVARAPVRPAAPARGRSAARPDAEPDAAAPALPEPELDRLGRAAGAEEIAALADLATLRAVAERCTRCPLHATRRHVVFADGSASARVMCVGEAPGAVEDDTGLPFVGPAGRLLDRLLLAVGFRRRDVYICNVLKCRPPNNRNPNEEEIARCSPFLLRQVALVGPEVILALGTFAAQTLVGTKEPIGRLRGRTHRYAGVPLVVTYHPAALLRNPGWTRPTWEDLQLARRIADGGGAVAAAPDPELLL